MVEDPSGVRRIPGLVSGKRLESAEHKAIRSELEASEKLDQANRRFEYILNAIHDGLWENNFKTGEFQFSDKMFTMLGYDPVPGEEGYKFLFSHLYPGDSERLHHEIARLASGEIPTWHIAFRMKARDGSWRHILSRGNCIARDEHGKGYHYAGVHSDITELKNAEDALRDSEKKHRSLVASLPDVIMQFDQNILPVFVSDHFETMTGIPATQALGRSCRDLGFPGETCTAWESKIEQVFQSGEFHESEFTFQNGPQTSIFNWRLIPEKDEDGQTSTVLSICRDITAHRNAEQEKARLQDQLNQAQKIESVGRLAGGVAHDFNNMMGVILGHTEMILGQIPQSLPLYEDLQEIRKAAQRSADLTRQLLAFARKQTVAPRELNMNETVEGLLRMMRRLIGESVVLEWRPASRPTPVLFDPSQIDQILVNLCVNARDALGSSGRITIETELETVDHAFCLAHPDAAQGDYVVLTVRDNGCGMSDETQSRLFEPFFTTKEVGQGTGLGLSTVYGIIKQNSGFITVWSEKDKGTSIRLFIPKFSGESTETMKASVASDQEPGHETILLVEDEPAILNMTALMLKRQGYAVLSAATPGEAVNLAKSHPGEIDLLMTDVVMPEMNGRDLVGVIQGFFPRLKHLFMSGYTADVIAHHGVLDKGVNFIQKPFGMNVLITKVRSVLDLDV